jgi:phosphoribosyl 1,2-cyclic phosphodiesterase
MRLTVLGSGSRGNALLVECGRDALLVDAGFSFKELQRRAELAGRDLSRVRALALTHEHGDHARGVARAAREWNATVAASAGTLGALGEALPSRVERVALPPARGVDLHGFRLTAFPTSHDARDPIMLIVEDANGHRVGVAYDVGWPTVALRHACRGLDALVIESNHDEIMLRSSDYPPSVRARIAGHGGHLSNRQAASLIGEAAHTGLSTVVLVHLSERCNTAELAMEATKAALRGTAFSGTIVIATQDEPSETVEVGAALGQLMLPLGG